MNKGAGRRRERHPRTPSRPRLYAAVAAAAAIVAAVSVLSLARAEAAALPPEPPALAARLDWAQRPTGEDMARYYPAAARKQGVEGRATVSCAVQASGALSGCSLLSETPPGMGFGDAALAMADGHFRMVARPDDVQPDPVVRIPVVFDLEDPVRDRSAESRTEEEEDSPWRLLWFLVFGLGFLSKSARERWTPLAHRFGLQLHELGRAGSARRREADPSAPPPSAPRIRPAPSRTPDIVTEARRRWPWSPGRG